MKGKGHVLLLRVFQHLPLSVQVSKHSLSPGNIFIERGICAREEVLFPIRVLLPRHRRPIGAVAPSPSPIPTTTTSTPNSSSATCISGMQSTATCRSIRIWILGRRDISPPLTKQLATILAVENLVALRLECIQLLAVTGELCAKVSNALVRLFLFGRIELLLCK